MNFEEFSQQYDEEWKKFPTDRVNRQIDRHKKKRDDLRATGKKFEGKFPKGPEPDDYPTKGSEVAKLARYKANKPEQRRHTMTAVKNYRTKMTDTSKSNQKFTGKDSAPTGQQAMRQVERASKKTNDTKNNRRVGKNLEAMKAVSKTVDDNNEKYTKTFKHTGKDASQPALLGRDYTNRPNSPDFKSDNQRQSEVNKGDKEARRKAKSSMTRTNLEKLYKKESMNYSEFLDHLDQSQDPLYKVEGKLPQCPPGYRYDRERKDCVPKSEKDKVTGRLQDNKDMKPNNTYNVWGRTGLNGDGYAFEEPFVNNTGGGGSESAPY